MSIGEPVMFEHRSYYKSECRCRKAPEHGKPLAPEKSKTFLRAGRLHAGGGLAVPLAGRMLGVYAYHFWMSSMDKIAQRLCVSPDRRKHGALKLF
ncbi:MAG: hypothetical protein USCGTAYLOR_02555 [Chromatiales bacterium USCg_Taylor]|nr:MAG: hypothetical protein USCGTAYLOR_02555 [Chromatiales bacterium USCg_Taylor]